MRKLLICLTALATGACAGIGPKVPHLAQRALTPGESDAVKAGVKRALKDPDSARFGDMIAGTDPNHPAEAIVCGYVNGKNSFGGYTGAQVFVGNLNTPTDFTALAIQGDDHNGLNAATMTCHAYGLEVQGLRQAL